MSAALLMTKELWNVYTLQTPLFRIVLFTLNVGAELHFLKCLCYIQTFPYELEWSLPATFFDQFQTNRAKVHQSKEQLLKIQFLGTRHCRQCKEESCHLCFQEAYNCRGRPNAGQSAGIRSVSQTVTKGHRKQWGRRPVGEREATKEAGYSGDKLGSWKFKFYFYSQI